MAGVYLAIPLFLNGVMGVPIQVAIPLAYVLAVTLHFNLQRHFVFRHVDAFALSVRQQIGRYVAIGAIQYPTTALAIAFLPELLGVSQRVMFVIVTISISIVFFLILRGHVFHASADLAQGSRSSDEDLVDGQPASARPLVEIVGGSTDRMQS